MARFFVGLDGRRPDEGLLLLPEIFHLQTQLAGTRTEHHPHV